MSSRFFRNSEMARRFFRHLEDEGHYIPIEFSRAEMEARSYW